MNKFEKNILITGGAGFIGSHAVRYFVNKYPNYNIFNLDALTYAGNLENLIDIESKTNYHFIHGDIRNFDFVFDVFKIFNITDVIHFAAETHVDRSITNPIEFINTNVIGTFNLLNAAKEWWKENYSNHRFHHVSTDEVYGALTLDDDKKFVETTKYDPHSPYSASKASSDHFVKAYHDTYGLNITISNCSNNYGPNQYPEKLIPVVIDNLINEKPIPVYGTGDNVRDWLYVEDHVNAIDLIFHKGKSGETYNIGGMCEKSNIELVNAIIKIFAHQKQLYDIKNGTWYFTNPEPIWVENYKNTIQYVEDRKGHDKRYAIDCSKLQKELGWKPLTDFNTGMEITVKWYLNNKQWIENILNNKNHS